MSSINITYFENLYNPQGQLFNLSLDELYHLIIRNFEVPYKDNAPLVIYGTLENNNRGSGSKVISRSCIAVDYDHISNLNEWFDAFCSQWDKYTFFMYSSFSHKMGEDGLDIGQARIRVIIPLECEVSPSIYENFVNDVFCYNGPSCLQGAIDKSSYQAKRVMFCHSCPIGNKDGFTYANTGKLLDISWYPVISNTCESITNNDYPVSSCEYPDFNSAIIAFNNKYEGNNIYKSIKDEEYIDFMNKVDINWFIQNKLSHIYINKYKNRYKYVNSESGMNGAIIYGNVLYSNHSSDPANNGHTNSVFNLLKIHCCNGDYVSALNYSKRLLNYRYYL